MLLVVARLPTPPTPRALSEAAGLTGLSAADVRTRLAGVLPRVLHVEADSERAHALAAELEALGFAIIACDPRAAPGDDERVQVRALRFSGAALMVGAADGSEDQVPVSALALIQRGVRTATMTEVTKESGRRLDLTRALLTGGLLLTRKVEKKATKTTTSREGFALLHRRDGGRDIIIYERRIDYRSLGGGDLQPSSAGNFERLMKMLREATPRVPFDDRVGRPGFVSGLPVTPGAAVDLALWLVHLLHLRGLAADQGSS